MASANINNNSEVYNRFSEYPTEATFGVNAQEDAELQRRLADKEGENHKRVLALQLSELLGDSLRTTWFQLGSSFVLNLLGSVRTAVSDKAANLATTAANKAGGLKQKTATSLQHTAEDVTSKTQELAHNLNSKTQAAAVSIKNKGVEGAQTLAHGLQEKGVETAHNLSSFAQEKASGTKVFLADKVYEYSQKLKDAVSLSFYKTLGSFNSHTNLTYSLMQEEMERARRMNSSEESYAIKNALRVAALIKGLSALYRPASEPYGHYSTRMLEESERSRRIFEVQNGDKAAIDNAKNLCGLINHKFNIPTQITLPTVEVKLEFNEEKSKAASGAAM